MPITSLSCSFHGLSGLGPDHWGPPPLCTAVPRAFAQAVLASRDARPEGFTVTELLGCLRESTINKQEDVSVDPAAYMSLLTGTAVHNLLASHDHPEGSPAIRLHGTIAGLPVSGEMDVYSDGWVVDYKWTGSLKWLKEARREHIVQVSLYAELARQNGIPARGWMIHYGGFGSEFKTFTGALLTLGECMAHPVDEDGFAVADNIGLALQGLPAAALPLTGEQIKYGDKAKCLHYCAVAQRCRELAGEVF